MDSRKLRRIAKEIVGDLLTSCKGRGWEDRGDSLKIMKGDKDLGGWCESSAVSLVAKLLRQRIP